MRKTFSFLWMLTCFIGAFPLWAQTTFKDIRIDLTGQGLLTDEEFTDKTAVSFGIVVAKDGSLSRCDATDAAANAVISGKYHNDHGWTGVSLTVPVQGMVKIGVGNCTYAGHTIRVSDAAGNEIASFETGKNCWKNNKTDEYVTFGYYRGEATTLTVSASSYTPYLSVEAVAETPSEATITYTLGDVIAEGVVPAPIKADAGTAIRIPANFTLYAEGKTLTGWNDGTATYAIGEEVTVAGDITLTPVFTDNTVRFDERTEPVTVTWDFQRNNGAPVMAYQGNGATGIYVAQALVNGQSIDLKLDFDATNGKINNSNNTDCAQMNSGTLFTIPACDHCVVTLETHPSFSMTTTTVDGQSDYTVSGSVYSITVAGKKETVDIVIGDGSYYKYIQVLYPVRSSSSTGITFDHADASAIWAFTGNSTDPAVTTPDGAFSLVAVSTGTLKEGTSSAKGINFVTFDPNGGNNSAVEWTVKPAKGLTFTPTKVSAYVARFGTDGGTINLIGRTGDGKEEVLASGLIPARNNKEQADDKHGNNENYRQRFELDVPASLASTAGFTLVAQIEGLNSGKTIGFSDVHICGTIDGTTEEVATYSLATAINPTEAATIHVYPAGETFEEGTDVTLTAVRNFGYKFINWTDAEGNEVSTETKFVWTVKADAVLTANFEKVNTYALEVLVEKPANDYMIQWTPAPTVIDGKSMYEEGTKVTLSTLNNKILTFTGWSNGETAGEISFDMLQDMILTANFAAIDFIAGWDFYKKGGDGRVADFAAADNDADQFVLRNAEGNTSGWLDKSQEAAGGYEGRPAAVNWRNNAPIGTYYWQTKVNAEAFTDIKVSAEMLYNYNAYQKQNVEYSLDGETWSRLGSIVMEGAKKWTPGEFTLPADADNQKEVYIRWKADASSDIDGTPSDNDGTAIANVFITGTAKLIDDGKAPVLVSTMPAENADNASANGKIVLTFDEKIQVADGTKAILSLSEAVNHTQMQQELIPMVSGKSIIFEYKGLDYSTPYLFTLPANSVSDLTDNAIAEPIAIRFTTKNKPVVAKALYDFIIPDNGDFKAALATAAKREDTSKRFRIFIKKGDYVIPADETATITGTDGKAYPSATTTLNTPNVSIIGEDMKNTVLVNTVPTELVPGQWGSANPLEGIGKGDVFQLHKGATNTYMQDITLRSGMEDGTGRNIVLNDQSNKTICKDVCLWAYQDTYVSNNENGRFYFEGGLLRGRTDFLCGKGDVYYNAVTLQMCEKGGYIAVPSKPTQYGYIFKDCVITGEKEDVDGNYTLGRPWGSGTPIALYIDTRMEVQPSAVGWNEMSGGWPARFAEYNSYTTNGTVIDLSNRKKEFGNDGDKHANNPVLTADEAARMTLATVMGGDDDWDPTEATEQASVPTHVKIENNILTWDNNDYILCWAIVMNGEIVAFTTTPSYTIEDETAQYAVRAANEMGGLGEASEEVSAQGSAIENISVESRPTGILYDLMGRRITHPDKARLYITDGKKFMVK